MEPPASGPRLWNSLSIAEGVMVFKSSIRGSTRGEKGPVTFTQTVRISVCNVMMMELLVM